MSSISLILVGLFVGLLLIYVQHLKEKYDYFKRRNILVPQYKFFFGHLKIFWSIERYSKQLEHWTKQYGSIYGLYEGSTPVYVVSDLEFLQEVYIKQFSSFHSRHVPFLARMGKGTPENLFGSFGLTWKRQRTIISPNFSSAKMKLMLPIIDESIQSFIEKCSSLTNINKTINIYELYKRMTMDIIWRSAFGIESDMQNDLDNIYMKKSAQVIQIDFEQLFIIKLTLLMPFLKSILKQIFLIQLNLFRKISKLFPLMNKFIDELAPFWIINRAEQIVEHRRTEKIIGQKRVDLLQMMIDSQQIDSNQSKNFLNQIDLIKQKQLDSQEIVGNILIFMIAGYETTSTTLAYATYVLASRQDIQNRLIEQIENDSIEYVEHQNENDYSNLNLSYMDMFIREVLRLYPIIVRAIARECNQTTTILGHQIEIGSIIQPDVFTIHFDRNIWGPEDPNEFIPERHLTKRHPISFLSFGVGPRNCIGMRFAMIQLKLTLKRLLSQFRILPTENFQSNFQLKESSVIHPQSLFVKLQPRNS